MSNGQRGLLHGGGFYLLGIQVLLAVVIIVWTAVTTLLMLVPLKYTIGIRMDEIEETLGSDFVEHGIDQSARLAMLTCAPKQEAQSMNGRQNDVIAYPTTVKRRSYFGSLRDAPSIRVKRASPRKTVMDIEDRADTGISTTSLSQAASDVTQSDCF
ncbi:hypothetical protein CAPTEDRAFT_201287 [Capitella teleta]|uniref:Ammonium transporter AmtB-like domain-containing protein n=1 Tax=Capitella teleta TaxID=283909 RepID=R7VDB4_CAPTE|nr:hypothetical protein CAPTEDRAFT_201287 [Capitella teleta]|eukprot:ELU14286.1 hypothetical protein CAPTEDRAFT_201287 [Capitella teleta]